MAHVTSIPNAILYGVMQIAHVVIFYIAVHAKFEILCKSFVVITKGMCLEQSLLHCEARSEAACNSLRGLAATSGGSWRFLRKSVFP